MGLDKMLLLALGRLVREEVSAGHLLLEMVDLMAETLGADRGTLYLVDEARNELVSVAAHLPEMAEIRLPISHGVAGFVARTGQVVNIPLCQEDHRFWPGVDDKTGYVTKTMLAGPIHNSQSRLIGVVQFLNKKDSLFQLEDHEVLAVLSRQAAILLEETTLGVAGPGAFDCTATSDNQVLVSSQDNKRQKPKGLGIGEGFNRIIGHGQAMAEVFRSVRRVSPLHTTVLVRGESGTGKGLIARAIHYNSGRRNGPFVQVDCTTLPEGLMENELFGHARGAYTGAHARAPGKVEAAAGGTLFLDEIGDLPLAAR